MTAADEASEAIIVQGVARLLPGVTVIAEESVGRSAPTASLAPSFVLVDPLDGTKEFLAGRDEFTVNLAIVTQGVADRRHYRRARTRIALARNCRRQSRTATAASRRRRGRSL